MQKALFPMQYLKMSQSRFCPGASHRGKNAYDLVGRIQGQVDTFENAYAPYDCTYKLVDSAYGMVVLESKNKVKAPNGVEDYQWMALIHDHVLGALGGTTSGTKNQNDWVYSEGLKDTNSQHIHFECGFGKYNYNAGGLAAQAHANAEDCLFVPNNCTIQSQCNAYNANSSNCTQYCTAPSINWVRSGENRQVNDSPKGSGEGAGSNPGGDPNPPTGVDDGTYNAACADRDRLSGQLSALLAAVKPAEQARDAAIALYDERRRDQTAAERELEGKETNAQNLRKENEQKLANLHTHIAALFEKTKTAVVQSIAALRQRIQGKLEAIRKRLQEAMSPITGVRGSLGQLVEDLFSQHRSDALQAQEYDEKELDAPVYDARDLSAFTYDAEGKLHI